MSFLRNAAALIHANLILNEKRISQEKQRQQHWRTVLEAAKQETQESAPSDYGWDSDDMEDWRRHTAETYIEEIDTEDDGMVEPLPSSTYSGSTPPTPAQPIDFSKFNEIFTDDEYDTRRSSSLEEEERNVIEPPFLTSNWTDSEFPASSNENLVDGAEWKEVMECCTAQQWMRWITNKPLCERPPWVIPTNIYTYLQPPLLAFPPSVGSESYFRQQTISNACNDRWNEFSDPLCEDLVHHHRTSIPLIPTGLPIDIDMHYMFEVIFEPSCAHATIQLRDPIHGRLLKLDAWVTDAEISVRLAVNHRRMNHVDNEVYDAHDERAGWWNME
jgi:hypothetical protein